MVSKPCLDFQRRTVTNNFHLQSKAAKKKSSKKRSGSEAAQFDQKTINEFKEAFSIMDQNKDGIIDKVGAPLKKTKYSFNLSSRHPLEVESMARPSEWVGHCLPLSLSFFRETLHHG